MDPVPGGSWDETINIPKKTLFDIMLSAPSRKFEDRCKHLLNYVKQITNCPEEASKVMKHKLSHFTADFKIKWKAAHYQKNLFLSQNNVWLETNSGFPLYSHSASSYSTGRGRRSVEFVQSSERSKRRKTEEIRSKTSSSVLAYAAQMSLRVEGNVDAAKVIKEVTFSTPKRAQKYKKAYKEREDKVTQLSGDEALSILVEAKLTRHQYDIIRDQDKKRFPAYKKVQEAKKRCYPDREVITVTGRSAEVRLQALLNHTISRIVEVQEEVLRTLSTGQLSNLILLSKWGCDGSSGQSQYKQKFEDEGHSDANIFLTSFVPLQLISGDPKSPNKIVIWQNPRPSSPRFCHPIHLQFVHETTDVTLQEKKYVEDQIIELPSFITMGDKEIVISHNLAFTMINGKVCNAASSTTSTQKFYLCGATSKSFNNIDEMVKLGVDTSKLNFGLSTLHAWIRFFECLLHVSYKLPIKSWQARGDDNKRIVAERKKQIQGDFKSRMGLVVDRPKPGYGSSNDGNTARRFFEEVSLSATITGINEDIITRFKVILLTISSGHRINIDKFKNYCLATARVFVEHYSWYSMPTTVHKILIHAPDVIASAMLPIGQLSEEAQEALNKEIKKYREGFARKCSREKTLEDVFNRFLLSSDPLITSLRKLPKRKSKSFSAEVLEFLLPPEIETASANIDSEEDISSGSETEYDSD